MPSNNMSMLYYTQRLKPGRATQIVAELGRPYSARGIDVVDPLSYFGNFFNQRPHST